MGLFQRLDDGGDTRQMLADDIPDRLFILALHRVHQRDMVVEGAVGAGGQAEIAHAVHMRLEVADQFPGIAVTGDLANAFVKPVVEFMKQNTVAGFDGFGLLLL